MDNYRIYRLERGLSPAEQWAADQRAGELAAALAELRGALGWSLRRGLGLCRFGLCRGLGVARALARMTRTRTKAGPAAAAAGK